MTVRELIEALQAVDNQDLPIEAFGPNDAGHFVARQVIGIEYCSKRTMTRGNEGTIIFIYTSVYDR